MKPYETGGRVFHFARHAADRIREMSIPREVVEETLRDPDEVWTNGRHSKYPDARLWSRAWLTLPTRECASPNERLVMTALPRTQDQWRRMNDDGLLGPDRKLRQMDHLPRETDLLAAGKFRPFGSVRIVELREACEYARAALLKNPSDLAARRHFDRLRIQLANAMRGAA